MRAEVRLPFLAAVLVVAGTLSGTSLLADGPTWEPALPFPDDSAGRTGTVGANYVGTIYALGGSPRVPAAYCP